LEEIATSSTTEGSGSTVSSLARVLGRDKAGVSRQLKILTDLGVVEKGDDGSHVLGWRLFALAARAGDQRLLLLAPAVMRELVQATNERVHLTVRHQDEVLTILTEGPSRAVSAVGWVGRTVPILSTSSGRALMLDDDELAVRALVARRLGEADAAGDSPTVRRALDRIERGRATGSTASIGEFEDGLSAVAAPVRDAHGRIVAAINVSAPAYRFDAQLEEVAPLVRRAAERLTAAISSAAGTARRVRGGDDV
jgi:DNA-binding IclR family transcriptional regulator